MRSIVNWIMEPNRRPFLRFARVATVVLLFTVLAVRLVFHQRERRDMWSISPSGRYKAISFGTSGWGPTVSGSFRVRVSERTREKWSPRPREVWHSYGMPPVHLEWHTDDSLLIVLRESDAGEKDRIRYVSTRRRPYIRMVFRELPQGELERTPSFQGWSSGPDTGAGLEDHGSW